MVYIFLHGGLWSRNSFLLEILHLREKAVYCSPKQSKDSQGVDVHTVSLGAWLATSFNLMEFPQRGITSLTYWKLLSIFQLVNLDDSPCGTLSVKGTRSLSSCGLSCPCLVQDNPQTNAT